MRPEKNLTAGLNGNSVRGVECMVVCCGLLCYANQLSPAGGYSQPWWVARVVECGNPGGDRGGVQQEVTQGHKAADKGTLGGAFRDTTTTTKCGTHRSVGH